MKTPPSFPYHVSTWCDNETSAVGWLVIDKLVDGIADGGTRMQIGQTREELERIAHVMTNKCHSVGMLAGGAKAGINYDPAAPDSKGVLLRFFKAHKKFLMQHWITAEDIGTNDPDIFQICQKIGVPSNVHAIAVQRPDGQRLVDAYHHALNIKIFGTMMCEIVTGFGVAGAVFAALDYMGKQLCDCRVAIQGFGTVGASAAKALAEFGVVVSCIADEMGLVSNQNGLDIEHLWRNRITKGIINRAKLPAGCDMGDRDDWLVADVDLLIPAAVSDAIHSGNVGQIQSRVQLVVEGANAPIAHDAERELLKRGIVIIPDFMRV